MPTITVSVRRNGERVKGVRVSLGAGLFDGTYGPQYTDYEGVTEFDVKHGQGAEVYVNGASMGRWGTSGRTNIAVNL